VRVEIATPLSKGLQTKGVAPPPFSIVGFVGEFLMHDLK
jgi:hypothetical protein